MNKYLHLSLIPLLFIFIACGGDSSSSNTETPTDNNTSSPQTATTEPNTPTTNNNSKISLFSQAFKDTGSEYFTLPLSYTCDGKDGGKSPLLSWSNLPSSTQSIVITMHSENSDGAVAPNFTLFNISSTLSTLPSGDFSSGTEAQGDMSSAEIAQAGGRAYKAPCASGAGVETLYTFTLYALSANLDLTTETTQAEVKSALQSVLLESKTLKTKRIRYDADALAKNLHVPKSIASTCAEKSAHFNAYSRVIKEIRCDEQANKMDVIAHIADGLKTSLPEQQVQVGITSWIGRLALPSEAGHSIKIRPRFLSSVTNNLACDGVETLGITVDGQMIFPYYKQAGPGGGVTTCGATDGVDYSGRDTVVLGEVDQCYGHAPNGEGYHMHGAPVCLMDVHDPSKPIAYMTDGIPLYFGQGGGTILNTPHAIKAKASGHSITPTNFGAGLYEHLDYRPADVKDGSNPLNPCNAYDINKDGATSGYAYYTTKEAPYAIGCYMGEPLSNLRNPGAANTRLLSERSGWSGQSLGEPMDVTITSNRTGTFNSKSYNVTEFIITGATPSFLEAGKTAQVLWRILDSTESGYVASQTCFEFRYRKDKNINTADETEIVCSGRPVPSETLDFTPFN